MIVGIRGLEALPVPLSREAEERDAERSDGKVSRRRATLPLMH